MQPGKTINESALAAELAKESCNILRLSEPLSRFEGEDVFTSHIPHLTERDKNKLVLECLVFDLFIVDYVTRYGKLSKDFNKKYNKSLKATLSESSKFKELLESSAHYFLGDSDHTLSTTESMLVFFRKRVMIPRFTEYGRIMLEAQNQEYEYILSKLGFSVGTNFFNERSLLPVVARLIGGYFVKHSGDMKRMIRGGEVSSTEIKQDNANVKKQRSTNTPKRRVKPETKSNKNIYIYIAILCLILVVSAYFIL